MNTPSFFQEPTLEFGHGADAQVVFGHRSGHCVPVCTPFLLVLRQSTCLNMASDRAKWSNYVQYWVLKVNTTPFYAVTRAVVHRPQVWTVTKIPLAVW